MMLTDGKTEDCVPRSYPSLEGQKLQNCKNFSREFKSWESWFYAALSYIANTYIVSLVGWRPSLLFAVV